jgi:hypothetical protein
MGGWGLKKKSARASSQKANGTFASQGSQPPSLISAAPFAYHTPPGAHCRQRSANSHKSPPSLGAWGPWSAREHASAGRQVAVSPTLLPGWDSWILSGPSCRSTAPASTLMGTATPITRGVWGGMEWRMLLSVTGEVEGGNFPGVVFVCGRITVCASQGKSKTCGQLTVTLETSWQSPREEVPEQPPVGGYQLQPKC